VGVGAEKHFGSLFLHWFLSVGVATCGVTRIADACCQLDRTPTQPNPLRAPHLDRPPDPPPTPPPQQVDELEQQLPVLQAKVSERGGGGGGGGALAAGGLGGWGLAWRGEQQGRLGGVGCSHHERLQHSNYQTNPIQSKPNQRRTVEKQSELERELGLLEQKKAEVRRLTYSGPLPFMGCSRQLRLQALLAAHLLCLFAF